jgi:hypothetical protein
MSAQKVPSITAKAQLQSLPADIPERAKMIAKRWEMSFQQVATKIAYGVWPPVKKRLRCAYTHADTQTPAAT